MNHPYLGVPDITSTGRHEGILNENFPYPMVGGSQPTGVSTSWSFLLPKQGSYHHSYPEGWEASFV